MSKLTHVLAFIFEIIVAVSYGYAGKWDTFLPWALVALYEFVNLLEATNA